MTKQLMAQRSASLRHSSREKDLQSGSQLSWQNRASIAVRTLLELSLEGEPAQPKCLSDFEHSYASKYQATGLQP
jgi:hypothetical protein